MRPLLAFFTPLLFAGSLEQDMAQLTRALDARVGVCVQDAHHLVCLRGNERFAMQSVMKLLVAIAVVEPESFRADQPVTLHREDLSLFVQPIAKLVGPAGYRTTLGDLVRRAIIDSDSAATDFLVARLGGPAAVQQTLSRLGVEGIRLDRDERHLHTETLGLSWRPEFVDATVFEKALSAVPDAARAAAWAAYQADPRDTATPRAMASLLFRLKAGRLLGPAATALILSAMEECVTFPDRLKAGLAPGWKIAHKTGSSSTYRGLTIATNDVGILTAPDGSSISIAVFVADSTASARDRAALIAQLAATAIRHYHAPHGAPPPSISQ